MNFEKRICKLLDRILDHVPASERKDRIHVPTLVADIRGNSRLEKFIEIFQMEYLLCGDGPREVGLAVFFDVDFHEIIRVEFEGDSTGIHCWFVDKQE